MNISTKKALILISAITASLSMSQLTLANDCKGQDETYCTSENNCRWVKSYQRKDGKTINAYCRTLGKKKVLKASDSQAMPTSTTTLDPKAAVNTPDKVE